MFETLGCLLVEAQEPSSIRPLAQRSLGGKPLVDWVLGRASEAESLDGIVVILPQSADAQALRDSMPCGVTLFQSDQPDALGRMDDCLAQFPARGIVNLRLDCPLLDPCLVDRLVCSVGADEAVDYATFASVTHPGETGLQSLLHAQLGLFAEYFRAEVLRKLNQTLRQVGQRRDFSAYIRSHPEQFLLRFAALPRELDRDDLRFSLRHQDDWDHAELIVDALGDDDLDWQRIVSLLQRQPGLRQRMADLNHADLENSLR